MTDLGDRYELIRTNIEKYVVGSPTRAAVQSAELLIEREHVAIADVKTVKITLPGDLCNIVNDRNMPDINVQYLVAGTLVDGQFSFAMAHAPERMEEVEFMRLRKASTLKLGPGALEARNCTVSLLLHSDQHLSQFVPHVSGTTRDPMTTEEDSTKNRDLVIPILGEDRAERLVDRCHGAEDHSDIAELAVLTAVR